MEGSTAEFMVNNEECDLSTSRGSLAERFFALAINRGRSRGKELSYMIKVIIMA